MERLNEQHCEACRVGIAVRAALAAGLLLAQVAGAAQAEPPIRYLGLDGHRARLLVDGRVVVLAPGETGPLGNRVVAAGPRSVWLRKGGRTFEISVGAGAARRAGEVSLPAARDGRFRASAQVNGRPAEAEVDLDAPAVLLTAAAARALGVRFDRRDGVRVARAGRDSLGFRAVLGEVRLGALVVERVAAVVVDGHEPRRLLLGAPFVERLAGATRDGDHLILRGRAP